MLTLYLLAIAGGLAALAWSAQRLIDGAIALALHLHVSAFTIGVVVLGFGTSLPELLVSATAAARGSGGIAIGNAFGSNIANIAMILGISALLAPLRAESQTLRRDLPLILLGTAGVFVALMDSALTRLEGGLLLVALIVIILWTTRRNASTPNIPEAPRLNTLPIALAVTLLGLVLLLSSAWVLVWGAIGLARASGIDELLIGLTVVAIGTSLPELAAALASIRRAQGSHLIMGNVVGSNLFNTLGVVGLPAVIRPFSTSPDLWRDATVMLVLTVLLAGLLLRSKALELRRGGALFLLLCYITYLGWVAQRMMSSV